jgi:zinc finger protein 830
MQISVHVVSNLKKVDMNDAYKEFEKEIKEDLQEVDDRLEEEEKIDAAAEREEYLTLE